ncbi:conserved hypothetical protein [Burkholderia latens]|uniref:gp53-like domain-containing protein n=1 Tax=Burkholderia latens TaxID=488446 RepID=UPI0039A55C09
MPSLFTFANNISTTLAGSISSGATSLTLSSAANLPSSIPAGKVFVITLNDAATRQQFEVIYATAISGATLSGLLRGQENTSAQAWSTGDYAYCSPTMGQMQSFGQLGDNNTWSGNNTFTNPVIVPPGTSDNQAINRSQFQGTYSSVSGWFELPDGTIINRATVSSSSAGFVEWTFPKPYPTACWQVYGTAQSSNSNTVCVVVNTITPTGVLYATTGNNVLFAGTAYLWAIGN